MRIILIAVGFVIASLSCLAQSSPANRVDNDRFVICSDGTPVCWIREPSLGLTNDATHESEQVRQSDAGRLQTYFYLLSGCKIPINHVDSTQADERMAYAISISIGPRASGLPCARITLRPSSQRQSIPVLYIEDHQLTGGFMEHDGQVVEIHGPRTFIKEALDDFGQKYFGVPVSAIDDPKFDWSAHHTNTLAISYDDFQPIRFPPASQ